MEYMEQKMDELIEAGLHMEAEMKPKTGQYVFEIKIPVTVSFKKRDDNTVSIDSVSVPSEDDIYLIVDKHAKAIKAGAEVRATDVADGKQYIVPGICQECGCQVTPENVGFGCDTFVVCKKCNKKIEEDWDTFRTEMQEEIRGAF